MFLENCTEHSSLFTAPPHHHRHPNTRVHMYMYYNYVYWYLVHVHVSCMNVMYVCVVHTPVKSTK